MGIKTRKMRPRAACPSNGSTVIAVEPLESQPVWFNRHLRAGEDVNIMSKKLVKNEIVIYQAKSGAIELRGDFTRETIWATQADIARVFEAGRSVITKHIRNIFKDKELEEKSVCAKFAHTADDGKTYKVQFYNLDIILSVGYRTNSKRAVEFRQWATETLHAHIVDGYTINRPRIAKNYEAFLKAVEQAKGLLPAGGEVDAKSALELVKLFADTWFSLNAYDKSVLPSIGAPRKQVKLTASDLMIVLSELKQALVVKKEAAELFGAERQKESVAGIVGNVFQSFGDKDLYQSVEEKAAHLHRAPYPRSPNRADSSGGREQSQRQRADDRAYPFAFEEIKLQ